MMTKHVVVYARSFPEELYPETTYEACNELLIKLKKAPLNKVEKPSFPKLPREVLSQMDDRDLQNHFIRWLECCNNEECSVCKNKGRLNTVLLCYHTFCYDCILRDSEEKTVCPLCRYEYEDLYIIHNKKTLEIKPIERKMPTMFIPDDNEEDVRMYQ